jgi:hypothetical protein
VTREPSKGIGLLTPRLIAFCEACDVLGSGETKIELVAAAGKIFQFPRVRAAGNRNTSPVRAAFLCITPKVLPCNFCYQAIALIEKLASLGSKLPELEFHKQFARMHAQPGCQLKDVE